MKRKQQPKLTRRVGDQESVDLSDYHRVKSGGRNASLDCGDKIAQQLRGLDLDAVFRLVARATGESQRSLRDRYKHLNVGMQRMNLGNRLRAAR